MKLGILVSVWPDYRWLVPVLEGMLAEFWPGHPEVVFTKEVGSGRNWTQNLLAGVFAAKEKGFDAVYLINEEHVPIGPCDGDYLNTGLPGQAAAMGAVYVSLFGWDNKRFCSKSPVLDFQKGMWMHLTGKTDPRFHLHPAWWRLDALAACCRLVLEDGGSNGSAWHFEKTCDDADAGLPEDYRRGCYQICAGANRSNSLGYFRIAWRLKRRWLANKAMAILPHLRNEMLRSVWLKYWNFDAVVSDGAYPMVFSGVLAKGRMNPVFLEYCDGNRQTERWMHRIDKLMKEQRQC